MGLLWIIQARHILFVITDSRKLAIKYISIWKAKYFLDDIYFYKIYVIVFDSFPCARYGEVRIDVRLN